MRLVRSFGRLILRVFVLSLVLSQASGADLLGNIRKLVVAPGPTGNSVKVSPSPSPNPSIVTSTTNGSIDSLPKEQSVGSLTEDRCEATPYSCHLKTLTACVQFAEKTVCSNGLSFKKLCSLTSTCTNADSQTRLWVPVEASLLVQNGGEGTLRVNASISPNNLTFTNIILLKSQARKIDVSVILRGNQVIILTSGNESCVIHIGLSVPEGPVAERNFFQKLPYDQVTPIHGVILFSITLLIITGVWACCKSRISERQGDGIPYQELEMAQSNSTAAVNMEEGGGGWDEVWDDDWDDDQEAIKSPAQDHREPNPSVNGLHSRSSSKEGWDEDWED